MPQYLVAIYLPDDPSRVDKATEHDIDVLNEETEAAGVGFFRGGVGPNLETKEHIGGFSVVEAANLDEVVAWARKAAVDCRVPVEVRQVWRPGDN